MPRSGFLTTLLALAFVAQLAVVSTTPLDPHSNAALCQACAPIDTNSDKSAAGCASGQALTFPIGQCVYANVTTHQGQHFASFKVKPDTNADAGGGYELIFSPDGGCSSGHDMVILAQCPAGSCCAVGGGELVVDGVAYGALLVGLEAASPSPTKGRGDVDSDHFPWWATMVSVIGGLGILLAIAALIGVFMYLRKRKHYQTFH